MLCCSPAWLVLAPAATASSYPRKNACHRSDVCLETLPKAGEGTGFSAGGGSGHVITAGLTASRRAWVKHRALGQGLSLCLLSQLEVLAPYLFRYAAAALSWSSESQGTYKTYPTTWGRLSLPHTGQKPAAVPAAAPCLTQ